MRRRTLDGPWRALGPEHAAIILEQRLLLLVDVVAVSGTRRRQVLLGLLQIVGVARRLAIPHRRQLVDGLWLDVDHGPAGCDDVGVGSDGGAAPVVFVVRD